MFCVAIQDEYNLVQEIYGPYANPAECLKEMDRMFKGVEMLEGWKFKIFPLLK